MTIAKTAKTFTSLFVLMFALANGAGAQETKIKWFGHAAFSIATPKGKVLLIDPWLKNPLNPEAANGKDPLAAISRADYILLTHGHFDHVGETVEIAKKTGAKLVANFELGTNLVKLQGFPAKQATFATIADIGGAIQTPDGEVTITFTNAVHSSSVENPNAGANQPKLVEGGNPCGFVIQIKNGPTIYDSGDTAYFQDMKTIGEDTRIDLALLFIGGHSGMGPQMAARAAKAVNARLAIPQHYGDLPNFTKNASGFAAGLKKYHIPFYEMKPGQTITFRGSKLELPTNIGAGRSGVRHRKLKRLGLDANGRVAGQKAKSRRPFAAKSQVSKLEKRCTFPPTRHTSFTT